MLFVRLLLAHLFQISKALQIYKSIIQLSLRYYIFRLELLAQCRELSKIKYFMKIHNFTTLYNSVSQPGIQEPLSSVKVSDMNTLVDSL